MNREKTQVEAEKTVLSRFPLVMFLVLIVLSIVCTFLARGDGPAAGEAAATRWISNNSLFFVDFFAGFYSIIFISNTK